MRDVAYKRTIPQLPPRDQSTGRTYTVKSVELPGFKRCTTCKELKSDSEFYSGGRHQRGVYAKCKICLRAYAKANPGSDFMRRYGISAADYDAMLAGQGGVCAICGGVSYRNGLKVRLSVDHHHKSGKVRGLLCHSCNVAIGYAKEDPRVLMAIAKYLETFAVMEM